MKINTLKITLSLLFLSLFVSTGKASDGTYNEYMGYFEDYCYPEESNGAMLLAATTKYSPNGRYFTPKGDLRALIIFAGFGAPYDQMPTSNWQAKPVLDFPDYIKDTSKRMFYSDVAQFENPTAADGVKNVSRYYYEMSNKTFRFMVDIFEQPVVIDPSGVTGDPWSEFNRRVLEKIKILKPNFNWGRYDNRKNPTDSEAYTFDGTLSSPDHIVDFVIIVWRYDPSWAQQPVSGMNTIPGSTGGFDRISVSSTWTTGNGYTVGAGYTQCSSGNGVQFSDVFTHEMAHGIYYCPHYSNANDIVGKYFYGQNGWGVMTRSFTPFSCANGWERWYLGWTEDIKASGVNADIKSYTDLNATGEYTLRDFITTGDVLRLKIPNGTGANQYLWLENHQGTSIFDQRFWPTDGRGLPFPPSARGVMGYIESINDDRDDPRYLITSGANGIKFLHAKGSYDYTFDPVPITTPNIIWGNAYYNFHEGEINPVGGQGRTEMIRGDFNEDGEIDIGVPTNGNTKGSRVDQKTMIMRDGVITHDAMGSEAAFKAGAKLSMASNPCLINRPQYDALNGNRKMGIHYLNGISVEFLTNSKVKVRYHDVDIDRDTRYSGFIHLPDITGINPPDIKILPGVTLKIDKSGTPNRHDKTPWEDFVNLTEFVCEPRSYFQQLEGSTVVVEDSSLLVVEGRGTRYEMKDGSKLIIRSGSTLMVRSEAMLLVRGRSNIEIEPGAWLCVDPASTVLLEDVHSVINLRQGSSLGKGITNSFSSYNTCNCATIQQIKDQGQGTVNYFGNYPVYVQYTTISGQRYYYGETIRVGRNVYPANYYYPQGDVVLEPGSDVIFDSENGVTLEGGFEAKKGATFEMK